MRPVPAGEHQIYGGYTYDNFVIAYCKSLSQDETQFVLSAVSEKQSVLCGAALENYLLSSQKNTIHEFGGMRRGEDVWKSRNPISTIDDELRRRRRMLQFGGMRSRESMDEFHKMIFNKFQTVANACQN